MTIVECKTCGGGSGHAQWCNAPGAMGPDVGYGLNPHYQAPDLVNHPPHYTAGGIECIDAIRAALTPEEFRGFCKGNMIKYVWRERHKGGDVSVEKAGWYGRQMTDVKA